MAAALQEEKALELNQKLNDFPGKALVDIGATALLDVVG